MFEITHIYSLALSDNLVHCPGELIYQMTTPYTLYTPYTPYRNRMMKLSLTIFLANHGKKGNSLNRNAVQKQHLSFHRTPDGQLYVDKWGTIMTRSNCFRNFKNPSYQYSSADLKFVATVATGGCVNFLSAV